MNAVRREYEAIKASDAYYTVSMLEPDDFAFWRGKARQLVQCGIPPDKVSWTEPGSSGDLFAGAGTQLPVPPAEAAPIRGSKRFLALARNAVLHSDPQRFALLYALLWRLQSNPRIMEDKTDPQVRQAEELDKNVRRDSHKMHAFVRFRRVERDDGSEHYVAWFEPDHHIVRANAGFFKRRFANMQWSILTPKGCIHWDGKTMRESPPAERGDAPGSDPVEALWRKYYASIFNPARLKVGAMMSEMPKKYWKNMPEAELIPDLIAGAQARESRMVDAGALDFGNRPDTLAGVNAAIQQCRQCPIGCNATQAVMGEGEASSCHDVTAKLMIIGEQPGDQEDVAGRPFVGPAGQVLDKYLAQAGIDRTRVYCTNAVKHFKFRPRGKQRIHQTPTAKEIDTCRWWLESERAIVKPRVILALGASAARGVLGKTVSVSQVRGQSMPLDDGSELWVTVHPSYLLRLEGGVKSEQERLFAADLTEVKRRLDALVRNG